MPSNSYIKNAHVRLPLPVQEGVQYRHVARFTKYAIGDNGIVFSQKSGRWKPVSVFKRNGYLRVALVLNGKTRVRPLHELLLEAFVCLRPIGQVYRHLDGNPMNNSLSNLQWGTPAENSLDRIRHGRSCKGEENPTSLLSEESVRDIQRRLAAGGHKKEIAVAFGIKLSTVYAINTGQNWKHLPSPTGKFPISPDMRKCR